MKRRASPVIPWFWLFFSTLAIALSGCSEDTTPDGDGDADADGDADGDSGIDDDDGDGIGEDGDGSGVAGDNPCVGGATVGCDDNCPEAENPDQADGDGDGHGDACDCGADNPQVYSGADELCDDLDNNCDGQIDEGFDLGAACTIGEGACRTEGTLICALEGDGTETECEAEEIFPRPEVCGDGIDNDCNGEVDDGPGPELPCADVVFASFSLLDPPEEDRQLMIFGSASTNVEALTVEGVEVTLEADIFMVYVPAVPGMEAIHYSWRDQSGASHDEEFPLFFELGCEVDGALDQDCDGTADASDLCPDWPDPEQLDSDGDGRGDLCDGDADGDGEGDLYLSQEVGPEGGILEVTWGPFAGMTLEVPAGALTETTTITLQAGDPLEGPLELSNQALASMYFQALDEHRGRTMPATMNWIDRVTSPTYGHGPTLTFEPHGLEFALPVTVSVPYQEGNTTITGPPEWQSLLLEGEEGLWFRGDEEEIDVTTFVDRENMRIVTTFDHFSTRTITKKKSPNALTSILNTWFGDYFHWVFSDNATRAAFEEQNQRTHNAYEADRREMKDYIESIDPCFLVEQVDELTQDFWYGVQFYPDLVIDGDKTQLPFFPLTDNIWDPGRIHDDLTQWAVARDAAIQAGTAQKVTPWEFFQEALTLADGNIFYALQGAHTLSRRWGRNPDALVQTQTSDGWIGGRRFARRFFADLVGAPPNSGNVYHMFGVAAYTAYQFIWRRDMLGAGEWANRMSMMDGIIASLFQESLSVFMEWTTNTVDLYSDYLGAEFGALLIARWAEAAPCEDYLLEGPERVEEGELEWLGTAEPGCPGLGCEVFPDDGGDPYPCEVTLEPNEAEDFPRSTVQITLPECGAGFEVCVQHLCTEEDDPQRQCLVVERTPPTDVHGTIVDGFGEPLAGVQVEITGRPEYWATTDALGEYTIEEVPVEDPTATINVTAVSGPCAVEAPTSQTPVICDMTETGLVVMEGATLTGRVVDVSDRLVAGAEVSLRSRPALNSSSGADGIFELRVPMCGVETLEVLASSDELWGLSDPYEVDLGDLLDVGDIVIQATSVFVFPASHRWEVDQNGDIRYHEARTGSILNTHFRTFAEFDLSALAGLNGLVTGVGLRVFDAWTHAPDDEAHEINALLFCGPRVSTMSPDMQGSMLRNCSSPQFSYASVDFVWALNDDGAWTPSADDFYRPSLAEWSQYRRAFGNSPVEDLQRNLDREDFYYVLGFHSSQSCASLHCPNIRLLDDPENPQSIYLEVTVLERP